MSERVGKVRNRAPAPIQVTAEQIIRGAQEFREEPFVPTATIIRSEAELKEYRQNKRKEFETLVTRKGRERPNVWLRYAKWEAEQNDLERARSVYERAIEVDPRNSGFWMRYAMMEMANKMVNHARNIFDRATRILPRYEAFWLKWCQMEETIGNISGARSVLERWISLDPPPEPEAWNVYINFEIRHENIEGARAIFERYLVKHNTVETYLKYAKFEAQHGDVDRARLIYERAVRELEEDANVPELFLAFTAFEESQKEYERARVIYKYALEHVPSVQAESLYERYAAFEKQYGTTTDTEQVVIAKRRFYFEEELKKNPFNYDMWFDFARMEERVVLDLAAALPDDVVETMRRQLEDEARLQMLNSSSNQMTTDPQPTVGPAKGTSEYEDLRLQVLAKQNPTLHNRVREVYERAIAQVPAPSNPQKGYVPTDKRNWRRYIYLWVNYAVYEELVAGDMDRARQVMKTCLDLIPHKIFTFSHVWLHAAHLEIRAKNLPGARKLLGYSMGICPREKVIKGYLDFELQLGNMDRCREISTKYVELFPAVSESWIRFAQMETSLRELERARAIYELALDQGRETMTEDSLEEVWKAYINFERSEANPEKVRALYQRRLQIQDLGIAKRCSYWCEWATWEAQGPDVAGLEGEQKSSISLSERAEASRKVWNAAEGSFKKEIQAASQLVQDLQQHLQQIISSLKQTRGENYATDGLPPSEEEVDAVNRLSDALTIMCAAKEARFKVLEAQIQCEQQYLSEDSASTSRIKEITSRMPQKLRKRKRVFVAQFGTSWSEISEGYIEYVFPEETATTAKTNKLAEVAKLWKLRQQQQQQAAVKQE